MTLIASLKKKTDFDKRLNAEANVQMPSDKFLTYLVSDWQVWPALRQRLIRSRPQISIISCRLRAGSGGSVSFQLSVRPMKLRAAWKAASGLWSVSARREKAELWTQTHSVTQSCRPHWLCRLETPPHRCLWWLQPQLMCTETFSSLIFRPVYSGMCWNAAETGREAHHSINSADKKELMTFWGKKLFAELWCCLTSVNPALGGGVSWLRFWALLCVQMINLVGRGCRCLKGRFYCSLCCPHAKK